MSRHRQGPTLLTFADSTLDERAIEAANEIRFRPATDVSVDSWITVTVTFTIR